MLIWHGKVGLTSSDMTRMLAWRSNVQILPMFLRNVDDCNFKQVSNVQVNGHQKVI